MCVSKKYITFYVCIYALYVFHLYKWYSATMMVVLDLFTQHSNHTFYATLISIFVHVFF